MNFKRLFLVFLVVMFTLGSQWSNPTIIRDHTSQFTEVFHIPVELAWEDDEYYFDCEFVPEFPSVCIMMV